MNRLTLKTISYSCYGISVAVSVTGARMAFDQAVSGKMPSVALGIVLFFAAIGLVIVGIVFQTKTAGKNE